MNSGSFPSPEFHVLLVMVIVCFVTFLNYYHKVCILCHVWSVISIFCEVSSQLVIGQRFLYMPGTKNISQNLEMGLLCVLNTSEAVYHPCLSIHSCWYRDWSLVGEERLMHFVFSWGFALPCTYVWPSGFPEYVRNFQSLYSSKILQSPAFHPKLLINLFFSPQLLFIPPGNSDYYICLWTFWQTPFEKPPQHWESSKLWDIKVSTFSLTLSRSFRELPGGLKPLFVSEICFAPSSTDYLY